MKRYLICLLVLAMLLSGCAGSYGQVNLQEPVAIPEDGVISANIIKQLREENAIGTFQGQSNGFSYEWTIFGSDIADANEINLNVDIISEEDGVQLQFAQDQPFGFPALLSVQLRETWNAQSATAYQNDTAVYSVSLTGSKETIVNLSVRDILGTCIIRPDAQIEETVPEETISLQAPEKEADKTQPQNPTSSGGYLSAVTESEQQVYTDGKTGGYLIMGKGSGQFAPTRVPASPSDVFSGYVNDGKLGGVYEPLAASYKAAAAAGGDLLILRRMRNIALRRNMQIRRFLSSVVLLQRVLIIRKRAIR